MRIYLILLILMLLSFGLYQRSEVNRLKGENTLLIEQRDEAIKTNKTLVSTINELE